MDFRQESMKGKRVHLSYRPPVKVYLDHSRFWKSQKGLEAACPAMHEDSLSDLTRVFILNETIYALCVITFPSEEPGTMARNNLRDKAYLGDQFSSVQFSTFIPDFFCCSIVLLKRNCKYLMCYLSVMNHKLR